MPEDIRRALCAIEITGIFGEEGVVGQLKKGRFMPKLPALDSLAKYFGMFQEGAVASPGLHISLHLGEDCEPEPAIELRRARTIGPAQ